MCCALWPPQHVLAAPPGLQCSQSTAPWAAVPCHTRILPDPAVLPQVLGRNLEGVVNAAMNIKSKMGDEFVSVEHLVLALADDVRFGESLFKQEGLTKAKLEAAVKEVGG